MRLSIDGDKVTHATFNYGDPSRTGQGSWYPPIKIDIQPYCGYSPKEHLSYYDDAVEVNVHGVKGYLQRHTSSNSSLFLWSGGSSINVYTWHSELDVEQAAERLIPIVNDADTAIEPLPAPVANSC